MFAIVAFILSFGPNRASYAQIDSVKLLQSAQGYWEGRTEAWETYLSRTEKAQQKLLKKLKKKEARLRKKMAGDSTVLENGASDYDSLLAVRQDTSRVGQWAKKKNPVVDSLRKIKAFGEKYASTDALAGGAKPLGLEDPTGRLDDLQGRLNVQQNIQELIERRAARLEQAVGEKQAGWLKGIQKDIYYAKEKSKAWKQMASEPDEAEEMAWEYLQGIEGFDRYMAKSSTAFGGLGNQATAQDLERLGYQTKKQMSGLLKDKFGDQWGQVQQKMGEQIAEVSQWAEKGKAAMNEARESVGAAMDAKKQLKEIPKPSFRKNPERGKPFWQRWELQYDFETSRAVPASQRPVMIDFGFSALFKHTRRLGYALGTSLSLGLGQDWQSLRPSYQGLTLRAFADWKWEYGFSVQGGYERIFRPGSASYLATGPSATNPDSRRDLLGEAFGGQQQVAYLGLMKRYKISKQWNGTLLIGYDFLWAHQVGAARSPFIFRIGWAK